MKKSGGQQRWDAALMAYTEGDEKKKGQQIQVTQKYPGEGNRGKAPGERAWQKEEGSTPGNWMQIRQKRDTFSDCLNS